jgi:hypothetical protein
MVIKHVNGRWICKTVMRCYVFIQLISYSRLEVGWLTYKCYADRKPKAAFVVCVFEVSTLQLLKNVKSGKCLNY